MYNITHAMTLITTYFGPLVWLVMFILSSIYIFLKADTAQKRAIVGVVIVFFFVKRLNFD